MNPFQINRDRSINQDKVFLVDKLFQPIQNGEIYPVSDLQIVANLNSNWECQFTVYRETEGIPNPLWDQITDLALVKIENKGIFELEAPVTDEASTYKSCSGKSICEAETSQTTMTLEINTEDDIARENEADPTAAYYKEFPTLFYRNINDTSVFDDLGDSDNAAKLQSLSEKEKTEILRRSSLLHRVFSEMPEYAANINGKNIDDSLKNLKYIFSWSDTSVYDICQDIAEEIQCIFIFDKFHRSFEVRDLKDHCEIDGCRDIQDGICPICQQNGTTQKITSFGEYSGVEIDTHNLAETINLSGNKDSVKNYFKIEGADDVITNRLSNRLIGNGYLWKTGALQRSQMSQELVAALEEREKMMTAEYAAGSNYQNLQDEYNQLWNQWNTWNMQKLNYESGMMPSPEMAEENAEYVFHYLFGTNGKINCAYASNRFQTETQIADSVIRYAKLLTPTNHTIEYKNLSYKTTQWNNQEVVDSITFHVHIYLDGHYQEEAAEDGTKKYVDEYPSSNTPTANNIVTLQVVKGYDISCTTKDNKVIYTNDYYNYLKNLVDMANAKSGITEETISFEPITPANIDPNESRYGGNQLKATHYSKYCYNRLKSFYDAYESCSAVVSQINQTIPAETSDSSSEVPNLLAYLRSDGETGNIQEDLLGKYQLYMTLLSKRMRWLQEQIKDIKNKQESLMDRIHEIKDTCDMENCLKKYAHDHGISQNLWYELCSFKRQDTYRNNNFIGEGLDDAKLMENVENLLKRAEEEIESACNITYSASATISNLLVMPEFEPFWDKFTLGNYIHMLIDDQIHTMRLTSITYDYADLSHCSVEFSDVIRKTKNKTEEIADILSQASSLASSAKTTARQAENGAAAKLSVDVIKNDALNLANSRIITADDQNFVIDRYGITGKYIDPIDGEVADEQIRIINNLLCFTDDNWQHTKTALGKISYRNPDTQQYETKYGLIGDTIIGNLLLGEKLIISDQNGYVRIDGNGITLDGGAITWKRPIKESAVDGLTENLSTLKKFKNQVNAALTGNAATDIGSDYVISPKIGGGYLYLVNENNSIILNPHAQSAISQSGLIQANNNMVEIISNKKTVLTVDKQGNLTINGTIYATNGEFTGTINATSGKFTGGLLLDGGYLTTNINRTSYNSQVPGLTLDKNGIGGWNSSEQYFNISNDGKLTAIGAQITGKIAAISGYIGSKNNGWTISNNAIYNGCENMTSVNKGTYIGTSGIKNVINNTCWVSIMNGTINSIGGDFVTEIKNGTINILSDYKINGAGILLKGGNDYDSDTYHQTVTIRPSYLDFSKPSKRRSAMGYIHIDADEQSDETGFYLIDSDNLIHGHFYMKNNSNASELMCTDIYCSNLICDHTTSYNGMTINLDQYITTNEVIPETNTYINIIGKSSSSTLWIGHYEKTYQWYTHSIQLNAGSTTSVGTFYTPDGSVSRSDIRLKTEITDIAEDEVNFILGLQPKKYKLKDGNSGRYHYGLIAQDVEELMQNTIGDVGLLVKKEQYVPDDDRYTPIDFQDNTTFYYGLRYEEFISPMIKTIQKLNNEIQELKEQIRRL